MQCRGQRPPSGKHSFGGKDDLSLVGSADAGSSAAAWETARHTLPPVWVDNLDEVNDRIAQIKDKLSSLDDAHTRRFMDVVDFSGETESREDREIEMLTTQITGCFRAAEQALKRVSAAGAPGEDLPAAERKIRLNVQRSMATQLQALSQTFRKRQQKFMARVKAQKAGGGMGGGGDGFDFLAEEQAGGDIGFNDDQMAAVELAEVVVEERDAEIMRIASSIEELSTIFKELAVLVIDQGTVLDRIDYNMEQVVERTKQGMKELETAEKHQKSSRPLKCICILLVLIAIMLGILINKHSKKD